jgi:hypothetical protein
VAKVVHRMDRNRLAALDRTGPKYEAIALFTSCILA